MNGQMPTEYELHGIPFPGSSKTTGARKARGSCFMTHDNPNLQYCLQFLKNGGEIVRAARLCADCTGMPVRQALKFVSSLSTKVPCDADRRPQMEAYCSECNATFKPETPECPLCQNPKLILRSIKQ